MIVEEEPPESGGVAVEVEKWNPRYVIYARSLGLTAEAAVERDEKEWPGGCMMGFILWMERSILEFEELHATSSANLAGRTEFDEYLRVFGRQLPACAAMHFPLEFDKFLEAKAARPGGGHHGNDVGKS
jgi:hypothetical protein